MERGPINVSQIFTGKLSQYNCEFRLEEEKLSIYIVCRLSNCKYFVIIDPQSLKKYKNLSFFFESVTELYEYLITIFGNLQISENGSLIFDLQVNMGQLKRIFQCVIDTQRQQLSQQQLFTLQYNHYFNQIALLKQDHLSSKRNLKEQLEETKELGSKINQYDHNLRNNDELFFSVLEEIKQIKKWKQKMEHYHLNQQKFISDQNNPHHRKFIHVGNKIRKISGKAWDVIVNKIPVSKQNITQYNIKQVRAGNNGSIMYGIGTENIKGLNRAQDSQHFFGYYEFTGNLYEQGTPKKGGPKVKDEEIVTIETDPKKQKISWYIAGKKEIQANIPVYLRDNNLFLSIIMFNYQSEIEFI